MFVRHLFGNIKENGNRLKLYEKDVQQKHRNITIKNAQFIVRSLSCNHMPKSVDKNKTDNKKHIRHTEKRKRTKIGQVYSCSYMLSLQFRFSARFISLQKKVYEKQIDFETPKSQNSKRNVQNTDVTTRLNVTQIFITKSRLSNRTVDDDDDDTTN